VNREGTCNSISNIPEKEARVNTGTQHQLLSIKACLLEGDNYRNEEDVGKRGGS